MNGSEKNDEVETAAAAEVEVADVDRFTRRLDHAIID
jgi:hypothetical protein